MEKKYLTGIKHLDFLIYNQLNDVDLLNLFLTNRSFYNTCNDDDFFKCRIRTFHDEDIIKYKPNNINFKQQYIDIITILYKTGFINQWDTNYKRIDLILVAHKYYKWIPNIINMKTILHFATIENFSMICDIFNYESESILRDYYKNIDIDLILDIDMSNVAKYIAIKYNIFPSQRVIDGMCRRQSLDLLIFFNEYGYSPTIHGLNNAIWHGKMDIIEWLHTELKLIPSNNTLKYAIWGQHYDIFIWLISNFNLEPNPNLIDIAVADGDIKLVKFLIGMNNLPDISSINIAVSNCKLETLKYLWNQYHLAPSQSVTLLDFNDLETLKWYMENFDINISQEHINGFARLGYIDMVILCYDKFKLIPDAKSIERCAINGHIEIIKWLYDIGVQMYFTQYIDTIAREGHLDLCKFIYKKYNIHPGQELANTILEYTSFHVLYWLNKEFNIIPQKDIL